jgi:hypothetical protein
MSMTVQDEEALRPTNHHTMKTSLFFNQMVSPHIFNNFAYSQKLPVSFVMSIRPSFCRHVSGWLHWTDFSDIGDFYEYLA